MAGLRMIILILSTLAAAVLLIFAWTRWQEARNIFLPEREIYQDPSRLGLQFEEVILASEGLSLHGWYVPGPGKATVLWLHGNAGNIADRVELLAAMSAELGVSHLLFDFRGYGRSQGRPTEKAMYRDAAAAYRWLVDEKGTAAGSVILYGHSLGSAVALDLALGAGRDAAGVVLESPFTSAREMARLLYNGFPVDWFMSVKLDNMGRIGGLAMPLLIIHGEADATIPFSMGKRLYQAATGTKDFLGVPGGDHSDCYLVGGERYWEAWRDLIKSSGAGGPF